MDLAKDHHIRIKTVKVLDWSTIRPHSVSLLFMSPVTTPSIRMTAKFLNSGGRVLVADDFRGGRAIFEALHLTPTRHPKKFPFAWPVSQSPLLKGVKLVACNHPASFATGITPLLAFPDVEEALMLSMNVGSGQMVLLSDPSIFINDMITRSDNSALASNLLTFLATGSRTVLIVTDFREVIPPSEDGYMTGMKNFISAAKKWLARFWDQFGLTLLGLLMLFPLLSLIMGTLLYRHHQPDPRRVLEATELRMRFYAILDRYFPGITDPEDDIRRSRGPRAVFLYHYLKEHQDDDPHVYAQTLDEFEMLVSAGSLREAGEHPALIPSELDS